MQLVIPTAVFVLMVSVGMSLDLAQFVANWRRISPATWGKLLIATFILPPVLALLLANLLPIDRGALVGLFLVSVAPGAPLMTRGVAKRGFDMELAASYQVWGALLTPIMIPLFVWVVAWLYGRSIWIPPGEVLMVIAKQQFAPLLVGVALRHFTPGFSIRIRRPLNVLGNFLLMAALIILLVRMGPTLKQVNPWVAIAAVLLAAGCVAASFVLLAGTQAITETLVICNVNRHVGLAFLLSGNHFQNLGALPSIVAYAFAAQIIMWIYARTTRPSG
jgi:bile acid:Na+ symporter, BASS family